MYSNIFKKRTIFLLSFLLLEHEYGFIFLSFTTKQVINTPHIYFRFKEKLFDKFSTLSNGNLKKVLLLQGQREYISSVKYFTKSFTHRKNPRIWQQLQRNEKDFLFRFSKHGAFLTLSHRKVLNDGETRSL